MLRRTFLVSVAALFGIRLHPTSAVQMRRFGNGYVWHSEQQHELLDREEDLGNLGFTKIKLKSSSTARETVGVT